MKKIISILIALVGTTLIVIGIIAGTSLLSKNIVVSNEIEKKKITTNIKYQQQLIKRIDLALQNGYLVLPGKTKENAEKFFDTTQAENSEYKNCSGEVEFISENSYLSYQLNTKCKKDKGNLNVNYNVTKIEEKNLEDLQVKKTTDGYFLLGSVGPNEFAIMKFDHNNHLQFTQKITDNAPIESGSYITVSDIYEDKDAYYLLGYAQQPKGGIFVNMIAELEKVYEQNKITTKDYSFSFLLKYDKMGNLLSTKIIDPVLGDLAVNKFLGKKDNQLLFLSSRKLIKYNTSNETLTYSDFSDHVIQATYLKDDFIYGYTAKCNFSTSSDKDNTDSIIKMDLSGKIAWNEKLENKEKVKKNTCSEYINNVYDLKDYAALVYNHAKTISVYDDQGKQVKTLDYSNLLKSKKDIPEIYHIERDNDKIKVFFSNSNELIIDTYNKKYKLENRYATGLYDATSQFEYIKNVDNIMTDENGFAMIRILNGNNEISVMKINYLYE